MKSLLVQFRQSSPVCLLPSPREVKLKIQAFFQRVNWVHFSYKFFSYLWLSFILFLCWKVSPFSGVWTSSSQLSELPAYAHDIANYFSTFNGYSECGLRASDLHVPPERNRDGKFSRHAFCPNRQTLLEAMTRGGRHGFDAPYMPKGCHYRWYDIDEVCMILERFESTVFVGDDTLQTIYAGLNILLRQDLALGALKQWEMEVDEMTSCRCENQFVKESCSKFQVTSGTQIQQNSAKADAGYPYACQRTPHVYFPVSSSHASLSTISAFNAIVHPAPPSVYKPIPIIVSFTSTHSVDVATNLLDEFLNLADASKRNTPMLWVGPTAAGHLDLRGRIRNQEVWQFSTKMAQVAAERDVESLGLWNMTVQANSWDGKRFGEGVAIAQAMMLINWLSRLPSS